MYSTSIQCSEQLCLVSSMKDNVWRRLCCPSIPDQKYNQKMPPCFQGNHTNWGLEKVYVDGSPITFPLVITLWRSSSQSHRTSKLSSFSLIKSSRDHESPTRTCRSRGTHAATANRRQSSPGNSPFFCFTLCSLSILLSIPLFVPFLSPFFICPLHLPSSLTLFE